MSCFMQKENDIWLNIDPVLLDGFIQKNYTIIKFQN
jgi:hypothetical protein